jgi:hypothetical protein
LPLPPSLYKSLSQVRKFLRTHSRNWVCRYGAADAKKPIMRFVGVGPVWDVGEACKEKHKMWMLWAQVADSLQIMMYCF